MFRLVIVLLLGLVSSSPVSRLVRQTRQSSNLLLLGAREGITRAEPRQDTQQFDLPAGEALDLFYRLFSSSFTKSPFSFHYPPSWIILSAILNNIYYPPSWIILSPSWKILSAILNNNYYPPSWIILSASLNNIYYPPSWIILSASLNNIYYPPSWIILSAILNNIIRHLE